jgi:hypothetical protein
MAAVEAWGEHENPQELGEHVVIAEEMGVAGLIVETTVSTKP